MAYKRYKRSKKKHTGGEIGSYAFDTLLMPEEIDNDEFFDYFIENEKELLYKTTNTPMNIVHTPSISVIYEDMEPHNTNILMGFIGNKPYYVCYITDGEHSEISFFYPIKNHTTQTIISSRFIYLDFLRKCRQLNYLDEVNYIKGLVRDPAFAVPIGVYLVVQKARRVRHEVVDEEFNKPSYHRKQITYNAYEILPEDSTYLSEDPMQDQSFWDQGFKVDIDEIFALCKREIDFTYLSKSITTVKKNARVVVIFGHDDKEKMKGIRVLIISGDPGTKDINYWGKFACADGLGAIIQKKSIEILRYDLAYLATTLEGERKGDNIGPVLRSWTNPNYIRTRDYRNMRFRAIKSAVPFWQYLGYSVYKLAPKGDAFFEAKVLPSDSGSYTKKITKRQASRSISLTNSMNTKTKKK